MADRPGASRAPEPGCVTPSGDLGGRSNAERRTPCRQRRGVEGSGFPIQYLGRGSQAAGPDGGRDAQSHQATGHTPGLRCLSLLRTRVESWTALWPEADPGRGAGVERSCQREGTPHDPSEGASGGGRAAHRCAVCSQPPKWNGEPLVLPIDHINGRTWDNRREYLRFLCPNCHSQTQTFGVRNIGAYSNGQRDHVQTVESVSSSLTAPTDPRRRVK